MPMRGVDVSLGAFVGGDEESKDGRKKKGEKQQVSGMRQMTRKRTRVEVAEAARMFLVLRWVTNCGVIRIPN
ncbi:hypothetical protein JD969_09715 [Planctomycetota bacterium]|nr:hypothetical protein JD969_09715 [Planctomycetota bacterium]